LDRGVDDAGWIFGRTGGGSALIYYAAVVYMHKAGDFARVMIEHYSLVDALETWQREFLEPLSGLALAELPCVCPIHFGIVGSGLHFEPPSLKANTGQTWTIYLDMANMTSDGAVPSGATGEMMPRYKIHPFPAALDNEWTSSPQARKEFANLRWSSNAWFRVLVASPALEHSQTLPKSASEHLLFMMRVTEDKAQQANESAHEGPAIDSYSSEQRSGWGHRMPLSALDVKYEKLGASGTRCYHYCKWLEEIVILPDDYQYQ
jgi:hypothetical protein